MTVPAPKIDKDYPEALLNYIRQRYHYSPNTGILWIRSGNVSKHAHVELPSSGHARNFDRHSRCRVVYQKKRYRFYIHRLAWFLYYGKFPNETVDHIDGDPSNNRIANLQDISLSANRDKASMLQRLSNGNLTGIPFLISF